MNCAAEVAQFNQAWIDALGQVFTLALASCFGMGLMGYYLGGVIRCFFSLRAQNETRHRGQGHPPECATHRAAGAVTDADVSDADWKCWCETNADNYRRYHL